MRKLALVLVLVFVGCKHDLQRPYVDAMIAVELVIRDDIEAGDYKVCQPSEAVLQEFYKANANADAALKRKDK